jgi:2-polyprenyl-3-methyl-5-hydroxy-6-metoxy-1,4-benzoquinol methylase
MFRKLDAKSITDITSEWDALAHVRLQQISSGKDITFKHVLAPNILHLAKREAANTIIDAGCGVGVLTSLLTEQCNKVIGVDPSAESVAIARRHFGKIAQFFDNTLEVYAQHHESGTDLVIANMVLMNVLNLRAFVAAARRVLRPGGAIIFSMSHPCFWPFYYGYAQEPWYRYDREIIIESPFRITAEPNCTLASTHLHRPLEAYVQAFVREQLILEHLLEPMPSPEIDALYPTPWAFPRYLFGICRR